LKASPVPNSLEIAIKNHRQRRRQPHRFGGAAHLTVRFRDSGWRRELRNTTRSYKIRKMPGRTTQLREIRVGPRLLSAMFPALPPNQAYPIFFLARAVPYWRLLE
jgi:hypothetical protein